MEPTLKENTLLENLVNKFESASERILNQTDMIEGKLNGKSGSDDAQTKTLPSGLLNRLELVLVTLEASGKNLTHILDTLI